MVPDMGMSADVLNAIIKEVREDQFSYFSTEEIQYFYEKNNGNIEATIHELLIIKSEDTKLSVSGMSTSDTSAYFKRLASRHRTFNTGILSGGC